MPAGVVVAASSSTSTASRGSGTSGTLSGSNAVSDVVERRALPAEAPPRADVADGAAFACFDDVGASAEGVAGGAAGVEGSEDAAAAVLALLAAWRGFARITVASRSPPHFAQ
jgi:hypothetical protein